MRFLDIDRGGLMMSIGLFIKFIRVRCLLLRCGITTELVEYFNLTPDSNTPKY